MAGTRREEAQQKRAEDRRKRRGNASGESDETTQDETSGEEPLDTVKHAAKVAAAAAAVGAAVGAARAMTGGDDDHDETPEPSAEQEEPREPPAEESRESEEAEEELRPSGAGPDEARRVVASAREQLAALSGKEADSVSGLERSGGGWRVTLEVVEVSRIPASTDVLGSYEVELDGDRNLVRYHRGRRYYRSQADGGEPS